MSDDVTGSIRASYDQLADEYARRIFNELHHKPLDRELLDRFATEVSGHGEVCDMGCGPGHVARYLRDAGATVFGLDLSPKMLEQARQLSPDMQFREGNMMALDLPEGTLAGITAFYAIVNIAKQSLPSVFQEIRRVLQPGGLLLLAFHTGDEVLHEEELWGRSISMDFFLFQPSEIRQYLEAAGLVVEEMIERDPYAPEVEYQSRRAYIFARKPAPSNAAKADTSIAETRSEREPSPMIAHTPKPYDPRFQFAVVMVRDQDRSLRFYVDQLRFHLVADRNLPSEGRWIVVEPPDRSVQLALVRPPENSNACLRIGSNTGLVLVTRDLETLCEEWSERGVSFPQSPTETAWQARTAIFQDIDGNQFTLVEYGPITQALDAERRAAAEKEQAERLLARELEIAKDVQARLLPQHAPLLETLECAGVCIPARHVGGDYYDFLELRPGRVALVLADIAGKGIAGALLMANLQANLRTQYATLAAFKEYFPLGPDDFRHLLVSVNRLFHENSGDNAYATLFFGNYDDATRRLSYLNCGHPPPLLLRGGGDQAIMERLDSTSTVIGLFSNFDCRVVEKQLAPGDVLIIYSDGITEAVNLDGEEFGENRLLEIARTHHDLSMSLLAEKLVEGARRFSHLEQADDITVIAARCFA